MQQSQLKYKMMKSSSNTYCNYTLSRLKEQMHHLNIAENQTYLEFTCSRGFLRTYFKMAGCHNCKIEIKHGSMKEKQSFICVYDG